MDSLAAVVLAAGKSTRFKSKRVKVLHPLAGVPMIYYVLHTLANLGADRTVLVIGHDAPHVQSALNQAPIPVEICLQEEQLGTGHALLQARPLLEGRTQTILALYGDMPLLTVQTLRQLYQRHLESQATITLLTVVSQDSLGFGRILRDEHGRLLGIVEEAVATPAERAIQELNAGVYCFQGDWLWPHLAELPLSPKGEYFLTDTVAQAVAEGRSVETVTVPDQTEVIGINTRVHLAKVEGLLRLRICERLMLAGVTILDPATTYVDATVEVGVDTVIYPNTILEGKTSIGDDCRIGPNSHIIDSTVGPRCRIVASMLESAVVQADVHIGPFAHLRPGSVVEAGAYVGNFAEIKNSTLGAGSHMGHFSYLGDATVGSGVNIGAGTITCNFDGKAKHRTEIGEGAFLGSDTMLVAPVRVGKGARTGAGAVVTKDVPDGALVVGVPARVREKPADKEGPSPQDETSRGK